MKPTPSLIMYTDRRHETEWLTENERYELSRLEEIAAVVATESMGVFAYIDGVKHAENGDIVGKHDVFDQRNGWLS